MKPVRLALVGYGRWGRNYIRAARDSGVAEVNAVICRPGSETPTTPNGCASPSSLRSWLDSKALSSDAVVYAGHPSGAADAVEEALAAGKPVLVEKPAGLSVSDAERIARAEATSKAFVLVGHQHLFAEGYEELVALARWHRDIGATARWRGDGPRRDYPPLWDYGPHAIAALLGLRSHDHASPKSIYGSTVPLGGGFVHGDVHARFYVGNDAPVREARITVHVPEGASVAYDAVAAVGAEPPLTRQVRAFARAVRTEGTDDHRFGAGWAVRVAQVLTGAEGKLVDSKSVF